MPISFSTKISVAPDVTFRAVGDESVLLNLKTESYLGLDSMGTRMWELLTSGGSIQSAFDTLLGEYDVEDSLLRKDVHEFIGKLLDNELIEVTSSASAAPENSAPEKSK